MSDKTLANWVFRARHGQLMPLGEPRRPVTDLEAEGSRLNVNWPRLAWSATS